MVMMLGLCATLVIGAHSSMVADAKPWKGTASNNSHTSKDLSAIFTRGF